ncbi:hypothetical protein GQ602_004756 [Ophiocordyceps camponoti-floridani]|uniref:Uncharacterized protein n=1 Tax=Ophiocordyceps camponoti-floridani TaxID=2030778 RepID=A0A8H4VCE3_9HYPO|nr:hypothetical protein GQ602_004756 [Ophiocordyceps camponoti-floridani]
MLAPHRDQENLVQAHQVTTKQQLKDGGIRFPKTPLVSRNDENAYTILAGKTGKDGFAGSRPGTIDRLAAKGTGKATTMVTPMGARTVRAPLGNKTTNAKARTDRGSGVKDMIKEIERAQAKHTTVQRLKPKTLEVAPTKLAIHFDPDRNPDEGEEPEYAPPPPKPLPYQSDVLPEGGLTFESLKDKKFLRGFYEHFHNPVGDAGVSREERRLFDEMQALLKAATERNEQEAATLNWNIEDLVETPSSSRLKSAPDPGTAHGTQKPGKRSQGHLATVSSKQAVSALAVNSSGRKDGRAGSPSRNAPNRKPLSGLLGSKTGKQVPLRQNVDSAGETASRTTIGYNKGRTASSILHHRGGNVTDQPVRPLSVRDMNQEPTAPAPSKESELRQHSRPQFLTLFDELDDGDLPPVRSPFPALDEDEEEEFELKLAF